MGLNRRHFVFGAATVGFTGLAAYLFGAGQYFRRWESDPTALGLVADPEGLLDLPPGFSYRVISRRGGLMADGLRVPGLFDGMAAFGLEDGRILLVRNHELTPGQTDLGPFGDDNGMLTSETEALMFDRGAPDARPQGGTTTLVYDPAKGQTDVEFLSLAGTVRNCAGGPTPWGSWLSCEESLLGPEDGLGRRHGYVFEVSATPEPGLVAPEPLRAMGRFNHEAAAVDPNSGIVYLTEDQNDSLFYRFVPKTPGRLHEGGRLQALAADGAPGPDSRNWGNGPDWALRESFAVRWIDIPDPEAERLEPRRQGTKAGASVFARGEGVAWGENELYFCCTSGGPGKHGQIFRYRPRPEEGSDAEGHIDLFAEPRDRRLMHMCDNIVVARSGPLTGDLVVCEDGAGRDHLRGVRPSGEVYTIARNALNFDEFAGACFSPDGDILFVNIQGQDVTLAISGPWQALTSTEG